MAKKQQKLPEIIWGNWNTENGTRPEDRFVQVWQDPEDAAEIGETVRLGVYKLVGHIDVKTIPSSTVVIPVK